MPAWEWLYPDPNHHSGVRKGRRAWWSAHLKAPKDSLSLSLHQSGAGVGSLTSTLALPRGAIKHRTRGLMETSPFRHTARTIPSPCPAFSGLRATVASFLTGNLALISQSQPSSCTREPILHRTAGVSWIYRSLELDRMRRQTILVPPSKVWIMHFKSTLSLQEHLSLQSIMSGPAPQMGESIHSGQIETSLWETLLSKVTLTLSFKDWFSWNGSVVLKLHFQSQAFQFDTGKLKMGLPWSCCASQCGSSGRTWRQGGELEGWSRCSYNHALDGLIRNRVLRVSQHSEPLGRMVLLQLVEASADLWLPLWKWRKPCGTTLHKSRLGHPNSPSTNGPPLLLAHAPNKSILLDSFLSHTHLLGFAPLCTDRCSSCGGLSES